MDTSTNVTVSSDYRTLTITMPAVRQMISRKGLLKLLGIEIMTQEEIMQLIMGMPDGPEGMVSMPDGSTLHMNTSPDGQVNFASEGRVYYQEYRDNKHQSYELYIN